MPEFDPAHPSKDAKAVLKLLKDHHNVLIAGPPATGKSRLLAELRLLFQRAPDPARPAMRPNRDIPLPAGDTIPNPEGWQPSEERTDRRIWSITFHQGTKYRDLVSGLSPRVTTQVGQDAAFMITRGPLYDAAEHAKTPNGVSLLEVDEINRGPAVTVFGDTITALEGDKRLLSNGTSGQTTSTFRMLQDNGTFIDYSLPYHLYIVAAMNEADTSVESLDVAFLRRFVKYRLLPDEKALREYFSLEAMPQTLPAVPTTVKEVYEAAVQAWAAVNDKIELARGLAFQLGHGIFMDKKKEDLPTELLASLVLVTEAWARIFTHVEEVFFGDTQGIGAVLQASAVGTPYTLEEKFFADTTHDRLRAPKTIGADNIYTILRVVAKEE